VKIRNDNKKGSERSLCHISDMLEALYVMMDCPEPAFGTAD
jgi:hypothetical protein